MDNLPLLKDIHLPPEVSAFPPAYGWFVIAGSLFLAIIIYKFWRYMYLKSKKYYALQLLKQSPVNSLDGARTASEILRRICRLKYGQAVSLTGQEWLSFLNEHCSCKLQGKTADLLLYAPYIPEEKNFSAAEFERVNYFVRQWIGENL